MITHSSLSILLSVIFLRLLSVAKVSLMAVFAGAKVVEKIYAEIDAPYIVTLALFLYLPPLYRDVASRCGVTGIR